MTVGLSHASAPLVLLERLYETETPMEDLVARIAGTEGLGDCVVLSTCSRLEIYLEAEDAVRSAEQINTLISEHARVGVDEFEPYTYVRTDDEALRHLFRVTAGLDSVVLGEDQILGQVKAALELSRRAGRAGGSLGRAFQAALRSGRRARNETGLNEAGRSLAGAGVGYFERAVGSLDGLGALVVGAGSFGGVVVAALRRSGLAAIHMANRTPDKAQRLAETGDGQGYGLDRVPDLLAEVDVVVTCTAATEPLITRAHLEAALAHRGGRPLYLLDLALPRNIDPEAAAVEGVMLVDLQTIAAAGGSDELSAASVQEAHRIVAEEIESYKADRRAARANPVLAAMRQSANQAARAELDQLARRLDLLDDSALAEVNRSVHRIVEKVLHRPTVRVRELAAAPGGDLYVDALTELFTADNQPTASQEALT
jgi:glutamyl-tRNA reductase